MKWLKVLQSNKLDEKKVGKKIATKIKEYKEIDAEIASLIATRADVDPSQLTEFDNEVAGLKNDLAALDNEIVVLIEKYIKDIPMNAERVKKMQEGRVKKAAGGVVPNNPAPTPAAAPIIETPKESEPAPTPIDPEKKSSWGSILLGIIVVAATGGLAYSYFKNNK